jgi:hypothetical protein
MRLIKSILGFSFCCLLVIETAAQKESIIVIQNTDKVPSEIFFDYHSKFAPFPDSARMHGHDYEGKHFTYEDHYDDSTVQILIPPNFTKDKPLELFVWFHGWYNNIDSAGGFGLTEQFRSAGRNAIFIFPEGPKNAPDSYGGKFERPEMFALFINDFLKKLEDIKVLPKNKQYSINDCSITLAGHSGAYRVISKIIQYNKIDELLLFDAMYGGNDAFLHWIAESKKHRFIQIYTKDGGTFENTNLIMRQLKDSLKVDFLSVSENELKMEHLQSNRPLFILSDNEHNEVITWNLNLYRFLHRWRKGEQWYESRIMPELLRNLKNMKN